MNIHCPTLRDLWSKKGNPGWSTRVSMRHFLKATKVSLAHKKNELYLAYEKSLLYLHRGKGLRIAFSESVDREQEIRRGFSRTQHRVEFGPLSPQAFEEFDLVVPLWVADVIRSSHWPQAARNPIPIPSEESVLLCQDKYEFNQTLIERGFGSCIPAMGVGLQPPYILKKRKGAWGRECWMIRGHEDELHVLDHLNDPEFFRQEIIPGRCEFATHILFAKGKIVKSLNIKYEFERAYPIKGQDHPLYAAIHRCPYLDLFARILKSIGFQGLCCLNYKVARGQPYLLEINPRFGGSLTPYFFSFIRHLETAPNRSLIEPSHAFSKCLRRGRRNTGHASLRNRKPELQ